MTTLVARDRATRTRDALAALSTSVDLWVATAGEGGPHLVPLSLAWIDERVVIAVPSESRTAVNLLASGVARVGVGPTRDVVLLDVVVERSVAVDSDPVLASRYADRSDWDPRGSAGYSFFVLRPDRVQAWREANELAGRTLMRSGQWLA